MRPVSRLAAIVVLLASAALTGCDLASPGSPSMVAGGQALGAGGFAITKTNADPATVSVAPGQTMRLSIETSRPASAVSWIATGGYLSSNSGNPVTWTAPTDAGTYTIGVTAYDGSEHAEAAYRFNVGP